MRQSGYNGVQQNGYKITFSMHLIQKYLWGYTLNIVHNIVLECIHVLQLFYTSHLFIHIPIK